MDTVLKILSLTLAVFLMMTLIWNLDSKLPRFPWDPIVSKFGYLFYVPIITSVIASMIISILAGYLVH